MNGVCVRWRGWIDLERLDGVGCLEYDEDKAQVLSQLYLLSTVSQTSLFLASRNRRYLNVKFTGLDWPTVI
jgi:hypothetical protein